MKNTASLLFTFTIILAFLIPTTGYSQSRDIKFGAGTAFLGSGDIKVAKFEVELTEQLNRRFSTSLSMNFGHGVSQGYAASTPRQVATTAHIDPNIFFSPFGNDGAFNLKLGTGASFMYVNDVRMNSTRTDDFGEQIALYDFEQRFSVGMSMIIEPEVRIGQTLISVKGIIQPYLNGDISSGVNLKFGRVF